MADPWFDFVEKARATDSAVVVVLRPAGGVLDWWDEAGPRATECMSVTKFVVSVALGLAVRADELRTPLRTWIEEWAGDERGDLTLAQVLAHTTGLAVKPAQDVYQTESVRSLLLDSQLTDAPGRFAYNNVALHLAGLVVERAAGHPLHELAERGSFEPLGVHGWDWQVDPHGFPLCMAGLWLRAPDLARAASLHLTRGRAAAGRQGAATGVDGRAAPISAGRGWTRLLCSVLRCWSG